MHCMQNIKLNKAQKKIIKSTLSFRAFMRIISTKEELTHGRRRYGMMTRAFYLDHDKIEEHKQRNLSLVANTKCRSKKRRLHRERMIRNDLKRRGLVPPDKRMGKKMLYG